MPILEFRSGVELRALGGRKLGGYASVFGPVAQIRTLGRSFGERVMAGAFTRTLADGHDVPALIDHDPSRLLARSGSGTLRLSADTRGLAFELDLPDTSDGRDMQVLAERRDLAGASIGFRVPAGGEAWPAPDMRELRALELIEISIAQAWPAYPDTSVTLRAWRHTPADVPGVLVRGRLLDLL